MFEREDESNTFLRNVSIPLVVDRDTVSQRTRILNFEAYCIDITLYF